MSPDEHNKTVIYKKELDGKRKHGEKCVLCIKFRFRQS